MRFKGLHFNGVVNCLRFIRKNNGKMLVLKMSPLKMSCNFMRVMLIRTHLSSGLKSFRAFFNSSSSPSRMDFANLKIHRKLVTIWIQGLILSIKIWVLRNFLTKIWESWTSKFCQKIWEIFRQNIQVQLAGQIFENFPQNILIGTHFENLMKFSEFREFCQNSENIFVDRTKPWML